MCLRCSFEFRTRFYSILFIVFCNRGCHSKPAVAIQSGVELKVNKFLFHKFKKSWNLYNKPFIIFNLAALKLLEVIMAVFNVFFFFFNILCKRQLCLCLPSAISPLSFFAKSLYTKCVPLLYESLSFGNNK